MSSLERITDIPSPPKRPEHGHKGTFGTVIVVGGSASMIGAPAIAARAAFRAGAGLVKIATAARVVPFALTIEPSATGVALEGDVKEQVEAIDAAAVERRAVLAIGPGLGRLTDAQALVTTLLRSGRRMVIDADGLNALAATHKPRPMIDGDPAPILTPHPGEFRRLAEPLGIVASPTDAAGRPEAAAALARAHRAVVVLKGRETVVTDGRRLYVNITGNAALATAGTGDVLTGLVAALLAQGMDPLEAAVLGVYTHGAAGDLWAREHGPSGLLARDLADRLPRVLHDMRCAHA
jgi:ADP-dependent NAD(P)H-hydrate dehydratase